MVSHDRGPEDIVLVVDDVPENLALLHDALDVAGYTVLVATDGQSALQRARTSQPDVILLDALMPGMDGFEVAQCLKADFSTQHIPIIFMTGLTETEHVVAAFASGGADYVTKPVKVPEVQARIAAHMQNSRQMKQARIALDATGQATVAVREADGFLSWQTPQARELIQHYFEAGDRQAHLSEWVRKARQAAQEGREPPIVAAKGPRRLLGSLHNPSKPGQDGEWLVTLREENPASMVDGLVKTFGLTSREAEVLYWVVCGKTNRDIGEILGSSHRTVNKHLEHVFQKLGVETRTAAAGMVTQKVRIPPSTGH